MLPAADRRVRCPAGRRGHRAAVARNSAVMAMGSVVSRITGFVRTAAIGAAIGVFAIGNDYTLANMLPGMVYELLLGGVLASVVVPLLVRARNRDADRGRGLRPAAAHPRRRSSLAWRTRGRRGLRPTVHRAARERQNGAGRPCADHHAVVPASSHDLLLRHGRPLRRDPQHPRPLRDADLRADPQQPRRHRDDRRLPVHAGHRSQGRRVAERRAGGGARDRARRWASSSRRRACGRRCAGSASAGGGGGTSASCTCASSPGSALWMLVYVVVSQVGVVVVAEHRPAGGRRRAARPRVRPSSTTPSSSS